MFDIAWSELLLIAVVALIFIGPKELPEVLRNLGRMTAKLRRTADDFRRQFEDSVREAGYEDIHKNIQDLRSLNPSSQIKDSITRAINQDYAPKPSAPAATPLPEPSQEPEKAVAPLTASENVLPDAASASAPDAGKPAASDPPLAAVDPEKHRVAPAA